MVKFQKSLIFLLVVLLLLSSFLGCLENGEEKKDDDEDIKDDTILTVILPDTTEKSFTLKDLEGLNSVESKVMYQNKFGNYGDEVTYKAVLIKNILKASSNSTIMEPGDTLRISASDGYTQDFCYYNVYPPAHWYKYQGDFGLAISADGESVPEWSDGPMSVMLPSDGKYSQDDSNATSAPGQGYFKNPSGGARFIRNSVKIEVISNNVDEWTLELSGELTEQFTKTDYEIMIRYYQSNYKDNDTGKTWIGVPLWRLLGRIDDDMPRGEFAFNVSLSTSGYEVVITAGDDYSKNITSSLILKNDEIILVASDDLLEEHKPVRVLGKGLKTSQMVFNVVKIEII